MERTANPRVKICCISSIEEAWIAIRCGASALGLVSQMPSGPGVISEELIAEIAACVPPPIATFLLTSSLDAQEIIQQVRRCRTNTVQICDRLESGSYQDIRDGLPGISIVQVIHVITEKSIEEAINVAPYVDAILLDSGNQSLLIKELGGTGRLHDWNLSAQIRKQVNVPIFLAGGLKPENVAIAVEQVAPFGLDLCSAVRNNGKLDENKLKLFFQQLNRALGRSEIKLLTPNS
ncbi:trpF, phosphoribosylanthranilate isomerase [Nostoc flagelliforme CCNUN1]|uniref:N-(5'-phosphoribosyl)anthranilate isomerase n=1 Tax=Nostoc flagelliforme CCNUN1 TaxID=2038116 RepID=A0A2K8SGC0_9NOSO|nr:phosphoribosylanthranilate isomerase [Nostoc flagelliforme]AUB34514.1 trpF, phosphoribosylanthranilate isomerase [Nostoc flagelliforme CCNUN1]